MDMNNNNNNNETKLLFSTDLNILLGQLKELDLINTIGTTSNDSMDDILNRITENKLKYRIEKENKNTKNIYIPPGGWKHNTNELTRKESKTALLEKKSLENKYKLKTIAAFRTSEPKWDGSFCIDKDLNNSLYRIPCRDPSGFRYFNVSRENNNINNKNLIIWKPNNNNNNNNFPDININSLTESFRNKLIVHISNVVEKETIIYNKLLTNTDSERNYKAKHGADLNNLILMKEKLLDNIIILEKQKLEKQEKEKLNKENKEKKENN